MMSEKAAAASRCFLRPVWCAQVVTLTCFASASWAEEPGANAGAPKQAPGAVSPAAAGGSAATEGGGAAASSNAANSAPTEAATGTAGLTTDPALVPPSEAVSSDMTTKVERGDYHVKLRDIEERVNQLKEKIFQSKARLIQLQEVVLHGTIAGAKAVLVHRNEMGSSFRLSRVQYALDGAPIFNRIDSGAGELEEQAELEIYAGSIAPGNHQISVYLEYQGYGYGLFSYLKGYHFKIKSSYTFNAEEGKLTTVKIVGYEKGGITTELKDRPSVRYDIEATRELRAARSEQPADAKKSEPAAEAGH